MPELSHAKHVGITLAEDGTDLVATVPAEQVAGGAGFVNVPISPATTVDLDLDDGRAFHHTMTANITGLTFSNVPAADDYSASWTWVLAINTAGGYTLPTGVSLPTVTFVDGRSFADADLTADAVNIFTFWRAGTITYGALVTTGTLAFDPYKVCFLANTTILVMTEAENIDVSNASKHGTGTITYEKNGVAIDPAVTPTVEFAVGNRLGIVCSGISGAVGVRVPRYAL